MSKFYCILQNTLIKNSLKNKLNKPIRMQTASITILNTIFRSMATSKEIQPTFQANWAPSTPTLCTLDHPGEVQVYSHMTLLPVKVKVEKCQQTTANCTTNVYFVRLQIYRTLKQEYCIRYRQITSLNQLHTQNPTFENL